MFANLCKVFLCVFHFSKALECYRCDNGKTEADCQQTTLCSIDQNMCYTEVRNTWDGEVSIMKSCYQDLACQTLVSQNGHNCPNVCAICCSGDLCNTRGPEFCSCEILTTTTIATTPPPTTTTETTRTTTTTAKTTTLNTARPTTRTTSSATNPMTTEIQNTTQAELETTTAARITDTTQDACTELKDIPLASTKLLCDEGNFTSCMSSNHSPIIVLDNDEYTINHKPSTTYNCRKLQSDTTVNLGTTSSSMTLSCVKLHPSASTTTVVNLEPSQPNYEGNLTIYCDFEDIFSDSLIEALPNPCNPTYIRCFVIFYPASLPGFTPTEATQSSEVTQTIEVTQAVKDVLSSSSQGVAVWLIIVIAIACTIAVVVSFVFLYKAMSSRGIYRVNKVTPKSPDIKNAKINT
uniref:cell wall protein DAN4-like isoform X2 n=1 Tax=Ciona intestinalis TaxID=7719 RepID=UPI00089DA97B|nr:cell wall protein DAN4-like isoform X2 [Ciona intestinalis]|eukprot:XP_018671602.1 cell wall protein DAN4-like isoform X2 [Ciona intestinalis]